VTAPGAGTVADKEEHCQPYDSGRGKVPFPESRCKNIVFHHKRGLQIIELKVDRVIGSIENRGNGIILLHSISRACSPVHQLSVVAGEILPFSGKEFHH
jgi:hypothetical protein